MRHPELLRRAARSSLAGLLCAVLVCPTSAWAQASPTVLQVRVVQGEGAVYAARSRATRGLTVQVTNETGQPVAGSAVTFQLPADGPSGVFRSGGRTEIIPTGPDGRAEVWGMQWNAQPGAFEMRIIAVIERDGVSTRGSVVCPLYLSEATTSSSGDPDAPEHKIHRSHKKLWIALGVAAAAGAAVVGAAGKSTAAAPVQAGVAQPPIIQPPTVTVTHP